ncbi:hypothetical protein CERSUDRAFT_37867, partial [Gelatoporia subvermispora B]
MQHRATRTQEILDEISHHDGQIQTYDDVYHGQQYLDAVQDGRLTEDDILLGYSLDGAQLYRNKTSDCWI